MSDGDLPFPWSAVDGDDGRFYYNEETGESQWEQPNIDVEDCGSQHSQDDIQDFGSRPELVYRGIASLGKERVRLVVLDSAVLSSMPDGALATLSCAPRELFRIEAVGGVELIEGTGDEPPPEGCVFVDVASLEQGWKGLPEGVESEGTLTALLAAADMEEAFISALHRLAHESQALGGARGKSKAQASTQECWNALEVNSRVKALFPDIFSPSELADIEVQDSLSSSSLLDFVWSEADSVNNVVAKVSTSPLEETALRVFSNLADERHKNFVPIAKERSWEVVADELQHLMGSRDENLDKRILEGSPHFIFKSSETDRQCIMVRLKNAPSEKIAAAKAGEPSLHQRSRSRRERARHMSMRNGSRSGRLPSRGSRRPPSPRRRSNRRDDHRSRRGGHRARSAERPRRDDHRRRSPHGQKADDRRSRPDRRGASRDAPRRDPRGDPRGEARRGPRGDRDRYRRDTRERSPRREQERRRSERRPRSPRGDPKGRPRGDPKGRSGSDKEPPWSKKGIWEEPSPEPPSLPVPKARPSVAPSVAPSLGGKVAAPTSAVVGNSPTRPFKFSGGISGLRTAADNNTGGPKPPTGPRPPPGPPPAWAQRAKSTAATKPSSSVPSRAEAPTIMKAASKAKPLDKTWE